MIMTAHVARLVGSDGARFCTTRPFFSLLTHSVFQAAGYFASAILTKLLAAGFKHLRTCEMPSCPGQFLIRICIALKEKYPDLMRLHS